VDSQLVSPQFVETLMRTTDDETLRQLIEDRAALVRSACDWTSGKRRNDRRPRSRDQLATSREAAGSRPRNSEEFAAAIRDR